MKAVFSVILSLVFLITSMGFTVSSHKCGGRKVKTKLGLLNADVSCGMEKKKDDCGLEIQLKPNCCQDEFQKIQIEDDYIHQLTKIDLSNYFLIAFVESYFNFVESTITEKDFFKDHSPPPLIRDIPVIVQSFLI